MLPVAAVCPGCGAAVPVPAASTAVRCESCGIPHLVLSGGDPLIARLASRTTTQEAAALACAAVADEGRRHGRDLPQPTAGDPVPFAAPVRVLLARIHEAAVVRSPSGDPTASVTARVAEAARSALEEPLALGTGPSPGEVDPVGLALVSRASVVAPPFDTGDAAWEEDARRLAAASAAPGPVLVRHVLAFPLARLLVLRPAFLVPVSSGRARAAVLVDAAARQPVALLSARAAESVHASLADRPLPASPSPALRPMRCPVCASELPLDREGQLRICPACRRAHLVSGRRLLAVSYQAELPPSPHGRILVPTYRVLFALTDPRDGVELASLAAVRARCGDARAPGTPGAVPFDVPAFLPADRRRERAGSQALPSLPEAAFPLRDGPAHPEIGFPDARPVGAFGPAEAVAVVRHALLAALPARVVALATPRRLKALLFDAPLWVGPPRLVLRSLPKAEAADP